MRTTSRGNKLVFKPTIGVTIACSNLEQEEESDVVTMFLCAAIL